MTQRDQVIEVMKRNGGRATVQQLYAQVDTSGWTTKTPKESIRAVLYKHKEDFFSIERGFWGLKNWAGTSPAPLKP